jgi:hypothetical protein
MPGPNDEVIRLLLDMGVSKENVQQVVGKLDELHAAGTKVAPALDGATKSSANLGQSLLQTGRITQDFVQGGIGGILNNIEGFTAALGLGSGLAGLFTVVGVAASLALPKIKEMLGGISGEAAEAAKTKLKELRTEVEKLHESFEKLRQAATEGEKTEASELTKFLTQRPNAEQTKQALIDSMPKGGRSVQEAMQANGTRDEWGKLGPAADTSDEEIERRAANAANQVARNTPGVAGAGEAAGRETRARLQRERSEAQSKRFQLERQAKDEQAERLIRDAQVAGPAGDRARRELQGRAGQAVPGLADTTEDAIAKRRAADEDFAQMGKEHNDALRRHDAQQRQQEQDAEAVAPAQAALMDRNRQAAQQRDLDRSGRQIRRVPPPEGGIKGMTERMRQTQAGNIQADVMQQGGATPQQAAQLQKLQAQLGKAMPTMDETAAVMQASQSGLVVNQQNFASRLQEARRILRTVNEVTTQQQQAAATGGW